MKQYLLIVVALLVPVSGLAQEAAPSAAEVARDVRTKINRISSFSATVETGEAEEERPGQKSSSKLVVSRLYGWKMTTTEGPEPYTLITDFQTFSQYLPKDKRLLKTTADRPEIKAMLTKPVTDMNPLQLLDPQSLVYNGQEKLDGETVYRIKGTTESQLMPGGPEVTRTLSAWIGVEDGLPRKTVESVGVSTGTTHYKDVKINPPLSPADFTFTAPPGTTIIDTNEQMRNMKQQMQHSAAQTSVPVTR